MSAKADVVVAGKTNGALSGCLFIDGCWRASSTGETSINLNPATGEVFAVVHQAGPEDVELAIAAADRAFAPWSRSKPRDREAVLFRAAEILERRRDDVISVLREEAGSVLLKSRFEVGFVADILRTAAGECRRLQGETMTSNYDGVMSFSLRRPLGVIGAIAPFNFPILLAMKKVAFAIAAGNTVVLKPADETPVSNLLIGEIFHEAGLPAGVLNVVPGPAVEIGEILTTDLRVKMLTFTGSARVGRLLATKAARNLKKFTLELGGKNPLVILDDADIGFAVDTAAFSVFAHQGQICMSGSRIIVHDRIAEEFTARFVAKAEALPVGDPRDEKNIIGPLIRPSQVDISHDHVRDALAKGARLLTGGTNDGNFFLPTVLTGVTPEMTIYGEETFGPVACIYRFKDDAEAIRLANDTCYGLSSAVLTKDIERAFRFVREIDAGMVHINGATVFDDPIAPFGGTKMSGLGREGGKHAIAEMTELKWATLWQEKREYWF